MGIRQDPNGRFAKSSKAVVVGALSELMYANQRIGKNKAKALENGEWGGVERMN